MSLGKDEIASLFGSPPPAQPEIDSPPSGHLYDGWIKLEGKRWRRVCAGDDFDSTWTALLGWQPPAGTAKMDRMVCTAATRPWEV